jgi:hypothetical protein
VIDRETLFHVEKGAVSEGYPLVAVYGDQGPQVAGWLDRCERGGPKGCGLLEQRFGPLRKRSASGSSLSPLWTVSLG